MRSLRVVLVPARPESSRALQRLSRLTANAWRAAGADVVVHDHRQRDRKALRRAAGECGLVHVIDPYDVTLLPSLDSASVTVQCHDLTDLLADLGMRRDAGHRPRLGRARRARTVVETLARVDRVVATSEFVRGQLEEITKRDADVLYPPIDPALTLGPSREGWQPPTWPFLLVVSDSRPQDRRELAFTAWASLRRTRGLDGASLIVVGAEPTAVEEEIATRSGGHVMHLASVNDAALAALYGRCQALLSLGAPSGFVWPIVEAHQAGRPVLATDHPVFVETGQSGCVYLPAEGITQFDQRTWTSIAEDLTARVVSERGTANAERFGWRRFVERLPALAGPPRFTGSTLSASASASMADSNPGPRMEEVVLPQEISLRDMTHGPTPLPVPLAPLPAGQPTARPITPPAPPSTTTPATTHPAPGSPAQPGTQHTARLAEPTELTRA